MIQSMTGYGKAMAAYKDKKIHVEVKSLNSKALDLSTRIAPVYREREMEIRQTVAKALVRGKVDVSIWIEKEAGSDAVPINGALVQNYYEQIRTIASQCGIPEPQDWWVSLLRLPDVTARTEMEELSDEEWNTVKGVVDEALNAITAFRIQEGAALERKFSIEPYEKSRVEKIKGRIVEGLKAIPEADYDKNRLEQELIYYIEKLDISEEKQRLANHLKYFRETMAEPAGQGKKLGFIAQEMGREINTTGSKSNMAEMQNIVVKMKDELEQIKEQVLNAL